MWINGKSQHCTDNLDIYIKANRMQQVINKTGARYRCKYIYSEIQIFHAQMIHMHPDSTSVLKYAQNIDCEGKWALQIIGVRIWKVD